jgi:hypothetical protein
MHTEHFASLGQTLANNFAIHIQNVCKHRESVRINIASHVS